MHIISHLCTYAHVTELSVCFCLNNRWIIPQIILIWSYMLSYFSSFRTPLAGAFAESRRLAKLLLFTAAELYTPVCGQAWTGRCGAKTADSCRKLQERDIVVLVTFRVSRRRREMYCGHAHLCVCVCVCLSVCPRLHAYSIARAGVKWSE